MTNFELTARWTIPTPLHLGTGLSLRGIADRTIRLDPDGKFRNDFVDRWVFGA